MLKDLLLEWRQCLQQGRQREGFTKARVAERLAQGEKEASPWHSIASSPFITTLSREIGLTLAEAIHDYVAVVCKRLPASESLIVSSTLNLDAQAGHLGERQARMSRQLNASSVATYRATLEGPAFAALSRALNEPTNEDLIALGVPEEKIGLFLRTNKGGLSARGGQVTVLGAAVMDLNFVITHMPEPGTSVQALRFASSPGGKGLSQAVACARLGLSTTLISVVGDDQHGAEIISYLKGENVATDLIVKRPRAQSAVTGVFTLSGTGASSAIGWKNDRTLLVGADLLEDPAVRSRIASSDFLLCSFELPEPLVSQAIRLAHESGATTIVTPAPPFNDVLMDQKVKSHIDFIVANVWELLKIAVRHGDETTSEEHWMAETVRELMIADQIKNVIVTHSNACHAFLTTNDGDTSDVKQITFTGYGAISESAGERDAFCAMLARRLHGSERGPDDVIDAVNWATAAMACVKAGTSVPDTMPSLKRVEDLVRRRVPKDAIGGNLIIEGERR